MSVVLGEMAEVRAVEMESDASPAWMRIARLAAFSIFALALSITVVRAALHAGSQFTGPHAFVSADVATTARTFASQGIWKLHWIPVNNNPPIGPEDRYTHWPPLLPVLLSACFRLFGASEKVSHLFMLGVLISTAILIVRLGASWLGWIGGALAGYFWLTLPVVVQFGDLVAQQQLAVLFLLAALAAYHSHRETLGSLLLFLAALSSWEAILVIPGLWLASLRLPELRRAALSAAIGSGAGVLCVAGLFAFSDPALAADTLQTAKYYMGLSPVYSHVLAHDQMSPLPFSAQISGILWNHLWMLGALAIAALLQLLAVRPKSGTLLTYSLAAPWILWMTGMRTHMAIHRFELLIAAPLAALALAWLATAELRAKPSKGAVFKSSMLVGLAAVQLLILPHPRSAPRLPHDYDAQRLIRYAEDVRNATEPGSIVLAPLESAVPIYYSDRHVVRGIADDAALSGELRRARREFPGRQLYLAIPPFLANSFSHALSKGRLVASTGDTIIVALTQTPGEDTTNTR
ncbi:MAG TPA: hypothetical protein VGR96_06835 [Acidobacteriaceae bacterium]|nr:hypothetical protein [Acidobacteriaceae bacterium]